MSSKDSPKDPFSSPSINGSLQDLYHLSAVHKRSVPSLLSYQSTQQNYRGFLNLCIALLFAHGVRLIIESWRHGSLRNDIFSFRDIPMDSVYFAALSFVFFVFHLIASVIMEKAAEKFKIPRHCYYFIVFANVLIIFLHTTYLVWNHIRHYIIGGGVLVCAGILTMKLLSHHFVNASLRLLSTKKRENVHLPPEVKAIYDECLYPHNLTLQNAFYFWLAPTLCYQPCYPRDAAIKKSFVIKRILELASSLVVGQFLLHQFMLPDVRNSVLHLLDSNSSVLGMIDNILKIASTSLYCWLLMFFAFFHAYLNLIAELLRFGDREFYQDWWNAKSLEHYWRLWNTPVHKWFKTTCLRTVEIQIWNVFGAGAVFCVCNLCADARISCRSPYSYSQILVVLGNFVTISINCVCKSCLQTIPRNVVWKLFLLVCTLYYWTTDVLCIVL